MLVGLIGYMLIGIWWVGICILMGAFKVQTNNPPLTLLFMASIWPYLFYRIVKGLLQGEETDLWP